MSRILALGLALAIAALAVVLWLVPSKRNGDERVPSEDVQTELTEPREPLVSPRAAGDVELGRPDAPRAIEAPPAKPVKRSQVRDESPRISGRIQVPGDFLPDEDVRVLAAVTLRSGNGDARELAALAAPDGSFELAVPAATDFVRLRLESRFLALPGPVKACPGEERVLLEPCVYAAIEGEIVPPRPLATLGVSWADLRVAWSVDPRRVVVEREALVCNMRTPTRDAPARPDDGGAFVLSHVPVGFELELHAANPFGPEWFQCIGPLEPGKTHRLVIELESGITITGRVIDEHGLSVEGVEITTDAGHLDGNAWRSDEQHREGHVWCSRTPHARSDTNGRFVLARLPRRILRITTQGLDLAREAEATVDGTRGDVSDLLLTVVRGGCIEGAVTWADGTPADGFEIRASGPSGRWESVAGGRFRLCGLEDGSYEVEVSALRGEIAGKARRADVPLGGAPIELRLVEERVFTLRGEVLDDREAPMESFHVRATRPPDGFHADSFRDGRFTLDGLEPGEWDVEAEALGHQSARQSVIVGSGAPAPLRFVLLRAGRIRGRVLDAGGSPVADAWVGEEKDAFMLAFADRDDGSTDAEGSFELQPSSARSRILAGKRGFSPSEVAECEVGPGETVEGVVLRLREPCRVEGRVLDEHGDPLPGVQVVADWIAGAGSSVETDAQGVFVLEGLPPGKDLLLAYHPLRDGYATATVAVAPGQTVSVDLRFEPRDPVLVHGRVTRGGKPVECALGLLSRGSTTEFATDSDGRFEVTLQRPGEWWGAVWPAKDSFSGTDLARIDVRRFEIVVPDADEHVLALELDTLPRLKSMAELLR